MTATVAILAAAPMLAACIFDVRRRIIPDTCVVLIAGVGLAAMMQSGTPALTLAAGGLCAVLGWTAVRLGAWGWGDAKLMAATGLVVSHAALPLLLFATAVAGGAIAALLLLLRSPMLSGALAVPAGAPRWLHAEATRLRRAPSVPYALAIAAGFAAALASGN